MILYKKKKGCGHENASPNHDLPKWSAVDKLVFGGIVLSFLAFLSEPKGPAIDVFIKLATNNQIPMLSESEGELHKEAYKVQKILKKRIRGGQIEYLVKWAGYPDSASTWEPITNLSGCLDLLSDFESGTIKVNGQKQEPFVDPFEEEISRKPRPVTFGTKTNGNGGIAGKKRKPAEMTYPEKKMEPARKSIATVDDVFSQLPQGNGKIDIKDLLKKKLAGYDKEREESEKIGGKYQKNPVRGKETYPSRPATKKAAQNLAKTEEQKDKTLHQLIDAYLPAKFKDKQKASSTPYVATYPPKEVKKTPAPEQDKLKAEIAKLKREKEKLAQELETLRKEKSKPSSLPEDDTNEEYLEKTTKILGVRKRANGEYEYAVQRALENREAQLAYLSTKMMKKYFAGVLINYLENHMMIGKEPQNGSAPPKNAVAAQDRKDVPMTNVVPKSLMAVIEEKALGVKQRLLYFAQCFNIVCIILIVTYIQVNKIICTEYLMLNQAILSIQQQLVFTSVLLQRLKAFLVVVFPQIGRPDLVFFAWRGTLGPCAYVDLVCASHIGPVFLQAQGFCEIVQGSHTAVPPQMRSASAIELAPCSKFLLKHVAIHALGFCRTLGLQLGRFLGKGKAAFLARDPEVRKGGLAVMRYSPA
eukprot:TRINITY_DN1512_c0_g1_i1.p2 TRINITY_DN1512_c0_g1~~TRINITY_DN1512_c0_g1_i1.p2  ORF type:complete len:643 (+),score=59.86 TRINITY_DN1512_c0_g1_i1:4049-5977(+)